MSQRQLLKVIAAALDYPGRELQAHLPDLRAAAGRCAQVPGAAAVVGFLEGAQGWDLLDWQARYVATFDRGRARSLYLFEHVHGESRARGAAMVELGRLYQRHGYRLSRRELPDFLPAFLEFLSLLEWPQAAEWLEGVGDILLHIHQRLAGDASPYAALFEGLARLSGALEGAAPAMPLPPDDGTPEALDRQWAEAPVMSGSPSACAGCTGVPTGGKV